MSVGPTSPTGDYPSGLTPIEDMLDPDDIPAELLPDATPGRAVVWTGTGSTESYPGTVISSSAPGLAHLSVTTLDGQQIVRDARFGVLRGISGTWHWAE